MLENMAQKRGDVWERARTKQGEEKRVKRERSKVGWSVQYKATPPTATGWRHSTIHRDPRGKAADKRILGMIHAGRSPYRQVCR